MTSSADRPGVASAQLVERGESYHHMDYGQVEVTGIWRGVEQVDKAHNSNEEDVYIVRFSTEIDGRRVQELTQTVDEFLEATE